MSYAGLGSAASYKRYWNNYAKMCQGMADEGACLNRAVQHGASVTLSASGLGLGGYSGLGQVPAAASVTQNAIQIAANLTQIGAQVAANPEVFVQSQAPRIVNALDQAVVSPLVDRATQRATPYLVRYLLPPLTVLYVLTGLATFYSFEVLKKMSRNGRVRSNRRRRLRRRSH